MRLNILLYLSSILGLSIAEDYSQKVGLNSEYVDGLHMNIILNSQKAKNKDLDEKSIKLLFFSILCYGYASKYDLIGNILLEITRDGEEILLSRDKVKLLTKLILRFKREDDYPRSILRPVFYYYPIRKINNIIRAHLSKSEEFIMTHNESYFNRIFESYRDNFDDEVQRLLLEKRFTISNNRNVSPIEFIGGRLISLVVNLDLQLYPGLRNKP